MKIKCHQSMNIKSSFFPLFFQPIKNRTHYNMPNNRTVILGTTQKTKLCYLKPTLIAMGNTSRWFIWGQFFSEFTEPHDHPGLETSSLKDRKHNFRLIITNICLHIYSLIKMSPKVHVQYVFKSTSCTCLSKDSFPSSKLSKTMLIRTAKF